LLGLGFGDEGKGTMTDWFCREFDLDLVVRFNGGSQAGHRVVMPDGRSHIFNQVSAATFIPTVETYISEEMLFYPSKLVLEARRLYRKQVKNFWPRLHINRGAVMINPYQIMMNQLRELARGREAHGSCGNGVGEAVADCQDGRAIRAGDLLDRTFFRNRLLDLVSYKRAEAEQLRGQSSDPRLAKVIEYFVTTYPPSELLKLYDQFMKLARHCLEGSDDFLEKNLREPKSILFENAQGALLHPLFGFHPHVTKTWTTYHNVNKILQARAFAPAIYRRIKVGILRAYHHRHGQGPLVTEDLSLTARLPETVKKGCFWNGEMRVGWFDLLAGRYGIAVNDGVDYIALTNLDRLSGLPAIPVCVAYRVSIENDEDIRTLDEYFLWEKTEGNEANINDFLWPTPAIQRRPELAKLLFRCRPVYRQFQGWDEDIRQARRPDDLPPAARSYLDFLASPKGLNTPIRLVSVGPTYENKFFYQ
jgi:adenylosuccinate synthase